jgi:hypothetical protein
MGSDPGDDHHWGQTLPLTLAKVCADTYSWRPVITVQHLTKRFGSHTAVDDLSFEVGVGEVLGFLAGTFVLMALAFYLPLFQLLRGVR